MESQGQSGAVSSLVRVLRRLTRIVQLAPFVYLLLLALYLLVEPVLSDWALGIADNLLNAPLYAVAGMLGVGRILKLCRWFRTACILPVSMKLESYMDAFLLPMSQTEVVAVNTGLSILFLLFIYLAFHHFFHGRTEKEPV